MWMHPIANKFYLLLMLFASATSFADQLYDNGEAIYLTGKRLDGSALTATTQYDVPLPPRAAACVSCHRRSGNGVSEGSVSRSLDITGATLFRPRTLHPIRPAYTLDTIEKALTSGATPTGNILDPLMPRYQLAEEDSQSITNYLRTLGEDSAIGVSNSSLVLATIIADNAPESTKEAVEQVTRRFVELKNASTRNEGRRAEASRRHHFGRNRQRAFRPWKHTIWRLHGSPRTWPRQLKRLYEAAPPFAILSGAVGNQWQNIDQFCNTQKLPCILPTDVGTDVEPTFYSLLFSRGLRLESDVITQHINGQTLRPRTAMIISTKKEKGISRQLSNRMAENTTLSVIQVFSRSTSPSEKAWTRHLNKIRPDLIVALLSTEHLPLEAQDLTIYTAETTSPIENFKTLHNINLERFHAYPYNLPVSGQSQFPREFAWLRQQKMTHLDPLIAGKTLFACHVVGEALADMQTQFSRPYLMEMFEHSLDGTNMTTLFPNTSLGPDQRVLVKGAFITRLTPGTIKHIQNSQWFNQNSD